MASEARSEAKPSEGGGAGYARAVTARLATWRRFGALGLCLIAIACSGREAGEAPAQAESVAAPDFTLPDLDGASPSAWRISGARRW